MQYSIREDHQICNVSLRLMSLRWLVRMICPLTKVGCGHPPLWLWLSLPLPSCLLGQSGHMSSHVYNHCPSHWTHLLCNGPNAVFLHFLRYIDINILIFTHFKFRLSGVFSGFHPFSVCVYTGSVLLGGNLFRQSVSINREIWSS